MSDLQRFHRKRCWCKCCLQYPWPKTRGKKLEGLTQLALALRIPCPQLGEKIRSAKKKAQQKFHVQSKSFPVNTPVENLTLQSGDILNADETECQQLTKIAPHVSGVILLWYEEARPCLGRQVILSQDDLALVIIGRCDHQHPDHCKKIRCQYARTMNPSFCRHVCTRLERVMRLLPSKKRA